MKRKSLIAFIIITILVCSIPFTALADDMGDLQSAVDVCVAFSLSVLSILHAGRICHGRNRADTC